LSGSEVIAEADITVNAVSSLSFTINPIQGLTVADIIKGSATKVANFNINSTNPASNLALRMVNPNPDYPYCTVAVGTNNSDNTAEFCIGGTVDYGSFVDSGNTYYKVSQGTHYLRSSNDNQGMYKVGADTYKVAVELVEFTL
ncbi:hypothetical protein NMS85_003682, partial [Vibrio cholerae]|nr:hypothetical protein [Vibrio cholerae]